MGKLNLPAMLDEERAKYVNREIEYEQKIESLRQQLSEAQADANRYRWLKDKKAAENDQCWYFSNGPILWGHQSLDDAIDAAKDQGK